MVSLRTNVQTMTNALAAIIVGALMTYGTMEAQTVNWISAEPPSPRDGVGMAYDTASSSTVLFSGSNSVADTWVWKGGWFQLSPATSPSPRNSAAMAYDGAAGNIVLFGGLSSTGVILGDTWTWNGTTWTQQFPAVSPPARTLMAFAYDGATKTVVLFGGGSEPGGAGASDGV